MKESLNTEKEGTGNVRSMQHSFQCGWLPEHSFIKTEERERTIHFNIHSFKNHFGCSILFTLPLEKMQNMATCSQHQESLLGPQNSGTEWGYSIQWLLDQRTAHTCMTLKESARQYDAHVLLSSWAVNCDHNGALTFVPTCRTAVWVSSDGAFSFIVCPRFCVRPAFGRSANGHWHNAWKALSLVSEIAVRVTVCYIEVASGD